MKTALLPSLTQLIKIADNLSHSFNAQAVRTKVLPVVSQVFKDNLLLSGPEMELMAIFLIHYKNTALAAVQSACLFTIDQFKPEAHPWGLNNESVSSNLHPCIQ